ncbi:MAG TPA: hypothetical protein VGM06_11015 [Polyangiaceae bacterium]|jgi:hypothetical protein
MLKRIRIRDVVRGRSHELGPEEQVLRGSYDLFHPAGPAQMQGDGTVEWMAGGTAHVSRVVSTPLGSVHVGERVLSRLGDPTPGAWWLCEVEDIEEIPGDG